MAVRLPAEHTKRPEARDNAAGHDPPVVLRDTKCHVKIGSKMIP